MALFLEFERAFEAAAEATRIAMTNKQSLLYVYHVQLVEARPDNLEGQ